MLINDQYYTKILEKCTTSGYWKLEATAVLTQFLKENEKTTFESLLSNGHEDIKASD